MMITFCKEGLLFNCIPVPESGSHVLIQIPIPSAMSIEISNASTGRQTTNLDANDLIAEEKIPGIRSACDRSNPWGADATASNLSMQDTYQTYCRAGNRCHCYVVGTC